MAPMTKYESNKKWTKDYYIEIDQLIREGLLEKAKTELSRFDPTQLTRAERISYCSLLRRSGLMTNAIKALQPFIYPKARKFENATADEILEYASNLVRLDMFREAERLLKLVSEQQYPVVLIRQSFIAIARWDYEQSNQFLLNYINHPHAVDYDIRIAQVNLLQGYVFLEKTYEAELLITKLINTLDPFQNKFLLSAVYEFAAEVERQKKNYNASLVWTEKGKNILSGTKSIDEFLMRKQELLIHLYKKPFNKTIDQKLKKLKLEAKKLKQYESYRDLNLHIAFIKKDLRLFNQLYWQSPYPAFQKRVLLYAQRANIQINQQHFKLKRRQGLMFDLDSAVLQRREKNLSTKQHQQLQSLKPNQALHRLFKTLFLEAYKPLNLLDFFDQVYSEEVFFPHSSENKIHQLIKRARQWIKLCSWPLEISYSQNGYQLKALGPWTLTRSANQTKSLYELQLRQKFKAKKFSFMEAQRFWQCSKRTCLRRLKNLKQCSILLVTGKTKSTKYQLID